MTIRDAALEYLEYGFSIIPIRPKDKRPLIDWAEYQTRQATEEEMESWFAKWPDANIALVTGAVSGVAVIDADTPEAVQWMKDNLPSTTVVQKTAKGYHRFYKSNGEPIPNAVRIAPGVDVRGDGGYVVIAPSIHPSGEAYRLIFRPHSNGWDDLPDFPKEQLPHGKLEAKAPVSFEPVGLGERNNTLARLAGRYFSKGMDFESVLFLCLGWNTKNCTPPQDEKDVEKTVQSIHKKHLENHPFEAESSRVKQSQAVSSRVKQCQAESSKVKQIQANDDFSQANLSLTDTLKDWVQQNTGIFTISDVDREFCLTTRKEKNRRAASLNYLQKQGLIKKQTGRTGTWRIVERSCHALDVFSATAQTLEIPYPLGLNDHVKTYPGSIIVVAGSSNAGKSGLSSTLIHKILNLKTLSRLTSQATVETPTYAQYLAQYMDPGKPEVEIHYFNSEMGPEELRERLEYFEGGVESFRKVNFWKRSTNFADVIRPNAINVIDFLEVHDNFYQVGGWLSEIHQELDRGIAIVNIQKRRGQDIGRGGEGTLEKARIYLAMDENKPYGGICKIVKAKGWKDVTDNPNGKEVDFKLVKGCEFIATSGWRHVTEKERESINQGYARERADKKDYAYQFKVEDGSVKGLNYGDLDKWMQNFKNINVEYELRQISKRTFREPWMDKKHWYFQVNGLLNKANEKATQKQETDCPF